MEVTSSWFAPQKPYTYSCVYMPICVLSSLAFKLEV